jgi:hypothetical protein
MHGPLVEHTTPWKQDYAKLRPNGRRRRKRPLFWRLHFVTAS